MYQVLFAEDELLVRLGLQNSIDWKAYDMELAAQADNGLQAYELFQKVRPDVVITDIRMEGMDGCELIEKIRQQDKECAIIVISCLDDFEILRRMIPYKIIGYILKASMTMDEVNEVLKKSTEYLKKIGREGKKIDPEKRSPEKELEKDFASIRAFEKQLTDDGMVIIKLFLKIDRKEQKKRFEKLLASKDTAWRVSKGDLKRNHDFKEYKAINEEMLRKTDADYAPWTVINATKKKEAKVAVYQAVIQAMEEAVARKELEEKGSLEKKTEMKRETAESILAETDLSKSMPKEVYEERLKALQKKMEHLHGELYRRRIPVVLGFEGWDAGGKGGAIKRLTSHMDPRGYVVNPTASPSDTEKAHHYLWRFWRAMPKAGHIAIFDRTWYGRVMVERIEGFCTEKEWKRAYGEINAMEQDLVNAGAIVLKFWMQIDKDEQARRFKARQENPKKQWKITDEDWRNREKWDQYEVAVEEMLEKTSMPHAPWIVVEGNDKYYARIKVLECVTEAIEKRLKEERK